MSTEANGATHALKDLQERVQLREAELRLARLDAAKSAYERRQRIAESFDGHWLRLGSFAGLGAETFSGHLLSTVDWFPLASRGNRAHGSNWPVFRDETTLGRFREASRSLTVANSYARGLLRNLTNYTVGHGFTYRAESVERQPGSAAAKDALADPDDLAEIVARLQDFVDDFCRVNRWNAETDYTTGSIRDTKERECYRRVRRDGEAILREYRQDDGMTLVRFIEPEQLTDPPGATAADGWSYGIQHQMQPFEDVATVLKYWIAWLDPVTQDQAGEEVDAGEIVHLIDPDTDSTIKRGLPAFSFDTYDSLSRAGKTQRNISAGAAIRAATAETQEYANATSTQVTDLADSLAAYAETNPVTGRTENVEHIPPGTIRRVPEGWKLVPKPAQTGVAEDLLAVQGDLRQASTAFSAPEYMTGDASNANYASTLVAGAPFVNSTEAEQAFFKVAFLTVLWRAVRWAVQKGRLDRRTLTLCKLDAEPPTVVQVDKLAQAQTDQIHVMLKAKAPQTVSMEAGLDPEAEAKKISEFEQRFPPMGGQLPMPDDGLGMGLPTPDDLAPRPPGGLGEAIQEAVMRAVREVLGGAASARPFLESLAEAGGTCKPGERSDLTGCVPASGDSSSPGGSNPVDTDPETQRLRSEVEFMGKNAARYRAEHQQLVTAGKGDTPEAHEALDMATRAEGFKARLERQLGQQELRAKADNLHTGRESVEQVWQAQGINATPAYREQVVPKLEEAFQKASEKIRVDEPGLRELLNDPKGRLTPEQAWQDIAKIGRIDDDTGMDWGQVFRGADPASNAVSRAAERVLSRSSAPDSAWGDWEDATQSWFDHKMRQRVQELKPQIMAALSAKSRKASRESVDEATATECDGDPCDQPGCPAHAKPLLEDAPPLAVPDSRQSEGWSCGAACVTSVCQYFGVEPDTEPEAIAALGSSPSDGTDPERIVTVLTTAGLETTALSGMDLDMLEYYLSKGRPVITAVQAWGTPAERAAVESGHYVVCCGIDADAVTAMDPARFAPGEEQGEYQEQAAGQKVRIPRDVFARRWVDRDAEGNEYRGYGVAVWKATP